MVITNINSSLLLICPDHPLIPIARQCMTQALVWNYVFNPFQTLCCTTTSEVLSLSWIFDISTYLKVEYLISQLTLQLTSTLNIWYLNSADSPTLCFPSSEASYLILSLNQPPANSICWLIAAGGLKSQKRGGINILTVQMNRGFAHSNDELTCIYVKGLIRHICI